MQRILPVKQCWLCTLVCLLTNIAAYSRPVITSFAPLSGSAGTTVTITGSSFNTTAAGNIVFFGATRATVKAASATSLTVTVPAGATYAPITVLNTAAGLAAYSTANFTPTFTPGKSSIATGDFAAAVSFGTGSYPSSVAVGDLDGDGWPDLAIANLYSSSISVLLNTGGSGTPGFAAKTDFNTDQFPGSVAIGDLDGDGRPDLAVTTQNGNVNVLLNNGSGGNIGFANYVSYSLGSNNPTVIGIAIGDLDGDGRADIATTYSVFDFDNFSSSNYVSVLLNTGSVGNASFAPHADFGTGNSPQSVAIADVDGDGRADLAVANKQDNTVSVLLNTGSAGTASFANHADFATGSGPGEVAVGDLDGDGKPDLAVANYYDNTVSVLLNTGGGSFAPHVDFGTGDQPNYVAIGDINGDGKADLVASNDNNNTVAVLVNTGSANFAAHVDFGLGLVPKSVTIADLNGDGVPDIAAANVFEGSASIIYGIPPPPSRPVITSFAPLSGSAGTTVTITGSSFNTTAAGNIVFFGATRATVKAASATSLTVTVPAGATYAPITVLNTAAGLAAYSTANFTPTFTPGKSSIATGDFAAAVSFGTGSYPSSVAVGDLDGDGWPDLAIANLYSSSISVLLNTGGSGTPGFAAKTDFNTDQFPGSVAIGDLDGDGRPDLAVTTQNGNVNVLLNNGSGGNIGFANYVSYSLGSNNPTVIGIAIGDLDGDGRADIATTYSVFDFDNFSSSNYVSVLLNTGSVGNASFAPHADFGTGNSPQSVAIADVDGDGRADLAVANKQDNTVSVLLNTGSAGTASFANHADFATGSGPGEVAVGDLDGDGKPDLAVANYYDNTVSVLLNTGGGSFAPHVDFGTGDQPNYVAIGDINGDGKADLVASNDNNNTVAVLVNTGSANFAAHVDFGLGLVPKSVAIADLNGDGVPDIAAANVFEGTASIIYGIPIPANTWTGTTNTDWATAGNWSYGTVPASTDYVLIPVTANQPIIGNSTTAASGGLTVNVGALLTIAGTLQASGNITEIGGISGTGTLAFTGVAAQTITGDTVTINNLNINNAAGVSIQSGIVKVYGVYTPAAGVLTTNGNLVLASTANGTASVAQSSASNYVTGNVTVERYIPVHRAWRLLTAPLSNTGTIYQNWQNNGVADDSTGANIWKPGGTGGSGNGFTAGGGEASIESYDPVANNWVGLSNTTSTLLSGTSATAANTGLGLFVTGPFGSNNIVPSTGATATTLRATGNLQTGTQQFVNSGLTAGTFMLVGNPYASPLNFTQIGATGAASGNISNTMWAWDAQRSGTSYGGYVTFSWDASSGSYDQDIDASQTAQTMAVQSGEAFFVQAVNNGTATVTINETDKAATSAITGGVFGVQPSSTPAQQLRITLSRGTELVDGVMAKFGDAYKTGVSDDVDKLFDYDENLSLRIDTNYLAIERRPVPSTGDTIFLDAYAMKKNAAYSFSVNPQNMPSGLQAWLVDAYTNTKTALSMSGSTSVSFNTGTDAGSLSETRFVIVFQTNGVLATATTLKAVAAGKEVQVEWTTPNELGVKLYQVQRSADAQSFTTINTATARNSGNMEVYDFTDAQALTGDNYYRIQTFNSDGSITYSNIVLVKMVKGGTVFSIYPNPVARNRQLQIQLTNMPAGKYALLLYSTTGKQLMNETILLDGTTTLHTISLPQGIAGGSYRVVLLDGKGGEWKQQVVVQ